MLADQLDYLVGVDRHRDVELRGAVQALRAVAGRVRQLSAAERELAGEIETLTRKLAPQLLEQPGVGPLTTELRLPPTAL
jgi:hypothetical protein